MDALGVVMVDLPSEVQIIIGWSQLLTTTTPITWSTTRGIELETSTYPQKKNYIWNLREVYKETWCYGNQTIIRRLWKNH
jgi:hypothetical protein